MFNGEINCPNSNVCAHMCGDRRVEEYTEVSNAMGISSSKKMNLVKGSERCLERSVFK